MSDNKREVGFPPLDRDYWGDIGGELGCREIQLLQAIQRISSLEAELQTVLDRAERYMDLCGEKDKEIEILKMALDQVCYAASRVSWEDGNHPWTSEGWIEKVHKEKEKLNNENS